MLRYKLVIYRIYYVFKGARLDRVRGTAGNYVNTNVFLL
jgi:hypothetical protein